jgi:hypothetical protein
MAFGTVTANASAHEPVYDAAMPGVTYGLLIATHYWLWHVLWHYTTFHNLFFFLWLFWWDTYCLVRCQVSLSRRLRHGHRMYVITPSCRVQVGMLTL